MNAYILGIGCFILFVLFTIFILPVLLGKLICFITFGHKVNNRTHHIESKSIDTKEILERSFDFFSGRNKLYGNVYTLKNNLSYKGIMILVPGYGCFYQNYLAEISYFARNKYIVFSYNGTGCGKSEGKNIGGYPQVVLDLYFAILSVNIMREYRNMPIYLFGHSIGAFAVTAVLNFKIPSIKGVIACSPINSGKEYAKLISVAYPCTITKRFLRTFEAYENRKFGDIANFTGIDGTNSMNIPIVIAHSEDDQIVPLQCSVFNYRKLSTNINTKFILYNNLGHFVFKTKEEKEYLNLRTNHYYQNMYGLNLEFMDSALEKIENNCLNG